MAAVNYGLRQSPLASGYGDLDAIFSLACIHINFRQFFGWLVETQTWLWVAGFFALTAPLGALWRSDDARHGARLLFGVVVWFLRFLLPGWPALAVRTAALVLTIGVRPPRAPLQPATLASPSHT